MREKERKDEGWKVDDGRSTRENVQRACTTFCEDKEMEKEEKRRNLHSYPFFQII